MKIIRQSAIMFLLGLFVTIASSFQKRKITEQQAIKIAEAFIMRNGYTNAPIDTTKYKLSYELNDFADANTIIKQRHNRFNAKAKFISENEYGWDVGFVYLLDSTQQNGRAVKVNNTGTEIWMAHKTPIFSRFRKIPN